MCVPFWYPSLWACAWVAGWVTGYQMGAARAISSLSPKHASKLRTPLLRLHVSMLKPNPNAGLPKPYAMRGGHLHLVRPD